MRGETSRSWCPAPVFPEREQKEEPEAGQLHRSSFPEGTREETESSLGPKFWWRPRPPGGSLGGARGGAARAPGSRVGAEPGCGPPAGAALGGRRAPLRCGRRRRTPGPACPAWRGRGERAVSGARCPEGALNGFGCRRLDGSGRTRALCDPRSSDRAVARLREEGLGGASGGERPGSVKMSRGESFVALCNEGQGCWATAESRSTAGRDEEKSYCVKCHPAGSTLLNLDPAVVDQKRWKGVYLTLAAPVQSRDPGVEPTAGPFSASRGGARHCRRRLEGSAALRSGWHTPSEGRCVAGLVPEVARLGLMETGGPALWGVFKSWRSALAPWFIRNWPV